MIEARCLCVCSCGAAGKGFPCLCSSCWQIHQGEKGVADAALKLPVTEIFAEDRLLLLREEGGITFVLAVIF